MSKFGSPQFTTVSGGNNSSFIKAFHKINDIPLRQYRNIILLRLNDGVQTTRNLSVLYLYKANIPYLSVFNIIERIQNFRMKKLCEWTLHRPGSDSHSFLHWVPGCTKHEIKHQFGKAVDKTRNMAHSGTSRNIE